MNYFQILHLGKHSKQPNSFKEFFFNSVFTTLSKFAPKKIFETSRTGSKKFFEGVFMIIFGNIDPRKCLEHPNDLKNIFRNKPNNFNFFSKGVLTIIFKI